MASYEIIGSIYHIGETEIMQTKNQNTFMRRSVTLIQRRFDQYTGVEFRQNFPTVEFTQQQCEELNQYREGDSVKIKFEIQGVKYTDKNTGEERYFNSIRAYHIEPFVIRTNKPNSVVQPEQKQEEKQPAYEKDNQLPF